jgi:hypothetical protein
MAPSPSTRRRESRQREPARQPGGMDYDLGRFDPQPLDGGSLQVHE